MSPKIPPDLLERAIQLQRKCWGHQKIADELGIHRVSVSRMLSAYNKRVMARLVRRGEAEKARQLARLDWMAEEAAAEWERSKLDAETTKITQGGGDGSDDKTELTTKGQTGDPRYLAEIRAAMGEARKILGLDAAPVDPSAAPQLSHAIPEDDPRFVEDGPLPALEGDQG